MGSGDNTANCIGFVRRLTPVVLLWWFNRRSFLIQQLFIFAQKKLRRNYDPSKFDNFVKPIRTDTKFHSAKFIPKYNCASVIGNKFAENMWKTVKNLFQIATSHNFSFLIRRSPFHIITHGFQFSSKENRYKKMTVVSF